MQCCAYVGLDVHKETIVVAGQGGGAELPTRLNPDGQLLEVCYEASPCGYALYPTLVGPGHSCSVVAPSVIPRNSGEWVKPDRCNAHPSAAPPLERPNPGLGAGSGAGGNPRPDAAPEGMKSAQLRAHPAPERLPAVP